jgi:hypothetical protein
MAVMTPSQVQAHLYATQNVIYAIASLIGPEKVLKQFEYFSDQMTATALNMPVTDTSIAEYEAAVENWKRQLEALIPA